MTSSPVDPIREINDLSLPEHGELDGQDFYHSMETSLGNFWHSFRSIPEDITYQAQLPDGIHLGAGMAALTVVNENGTTHSSNGPLASYFMQSEATPHSVTTTIQAGKALSCGLFIPIDDNLKMPEEINKFRQKFDGLQGFQGSSNILSSVIQKLCCPVEAWFQGDSLRLLGESRAYELLAVVTAAFSNPEPVQHINMKHAVAAREILDANLMKTPTLQVLAKQTGTNVRSLTQAFRYQYGVSINQYVTECRMDKALSLLEQGKTVSETAYLVGYSLPYFSERFQKRFGMPASKLLVCSNLPKH